MRFLPFFLLLRLALGVFFFLLGGSELPSASARERFDDDAPPAAAARAGVPGGALAAAVAAAGVPENDAMKAIQDVYQAGLDNLQKMFGN